jgi:hypothetical protein
MVGKAFRTNELQCGAYLDIVNTLGFGNEEAAPKSKPPSW